MPKAMAPTALTAQFPRNADIWAGFGGDAGAPAVISKVTDNAVSGLLADPEEAPYFADIGRPRYDTAGRPKACLDLQFKALFDGLSSHPGQVAVNGTIVMYDDAATAHSDVGIPDCVFDQFITNAAAVVKTNGVPDGHTSRVAPILIGLEPIIVSIMSWYLSPNTARNYK